ncbi:MAG: porin [Desulfobacteraceae bacterium]|nr:porin [Desulfobacteraceae bacterium]
MKKLLWLIGLIFVFILLMETTILFGNNQARAQENEQEADFNDDDSAEGSSDTQKLLSELKQKFNLKLYLDFMYEQSIGDSENSSTQREVDEPTFSSNHSYLLLNASPSDKLRVGFDIQFRHYYEIEYFPIPSLSFKVGKIYLPFGDFKYHPIYGGKVYSLDNDLFPNWFTDYGIAFGHKLLDTDSFSLNYDFFTSNGFQRGSDGDVNMNTIGFSNDNNSDKAYGGRIKATFWGNYNVTASGMTDRFSNDGQASLTLWAADFSTNSGIFRLPFFNRINLRLGYIDKHIENEAVSDSFLQDYDGFGSHLELSIKAANWLKLSFRAGEVDPNDKVQDIMDQRNYNAHAIFYLEKYLELWTIYQINEEKYVDEVDNDYLALKVVMNF